MKDAENIGLIKQVKSLVSALIELKDYNARIGKESSGGNHPGFVFMGADDRNDEAYYVNEKTGQVLHHTWSVSGHNGDSYGDEYKVLDAEEATKVLKGMCSSLIRRGIDLEKKLKEEEQRKKETDQLRERFLSRVKQ